MVKVIIFLFLHLLIGFISVMGFLIIGYQKYKFSHRLYLCDIDKYLEYAFDWDIIKILFLFLAPVCTVFAFIIYYGSVWLIKNILKYSDEVINGRKDKK